MSTFQTDRRNRLVAPLLAALSALALAAPDPIKTFCIEPNDIVFFVRRGARASHYEGVRAVAREPVTIAVCGIGPITLHPVDPSRPVIR